MGPNAGALYHRFEQMVVDCGELHILPARTRLAFLARARFAGMTSISEKDRSDVAIRYGNMYAYRLCQALGLDPDDGVVRVSAVHYNTTDELPGFIAVTDDKPIGLILYNIEGEYCEVVSLDSLVEGIGVGTALVEAVEKAALDAGCIRLWLITTNDNLKALGFYQKRGFCLTAVYPNALERSRKMKPEIPLTGRDGIPLRDEMELAKRLPRDENSSTRVPPSASGPL